MIMSKMKLTVNSVENYKDLDTLSKKLSLTETSSRFNPKKVIKSAIDLTQQSEASLHPNV